MAGEINNRTTAFPKAELRPMAGKTELAVAMAAERPGHRPERVSWILNAAYETIAGQAVTLDVVRLLPSGSREWLLQQAAQYFRPDLNWFEATCNHCGQPYDLSLKLTDAARYQPDMELTEVELKTSLGMRSFVIPNGAHEEAYARLEHASDPVSSGQGHSDPRCIFAVLCGLSDRAEEEAAQFNEFDLALIDEALEAASPDVSDVTQGVCPSCGLQTTARIDPLLFAFPQEGNILQEAHLIASAYGWSHDQILNLSVRYRSFYAAMITRDQRQMQRSARWRST